MSTVLDFPVELTPDQAAITWELEKLHWPRQVTPLSFSTAMASFMRGRNAANAEVGRPFRVHGLRLNTYCYEGVVVSGEYRFMFAVPFETLWGLKASRGGIDTWLEDLKVAGLPAGEKLVIGLYYYEDLTLREIGEVLGVGPTRTAQLHTAAVRRLRGWLQADGRI